MVKKQVTDTSKLIIAGTVKIGVPSKMLNYTKTGRKSIINTLTKTGKVSVRNSKPVISFSDTNDTNKHLISINNDGETEYRNKLYKDQNIFGAVGKITSKQKTKLQDEIKVLNLKTKEGRNKKEILDKELFDADKRYLHMSDMQHNIYRKLNNNN